MEFQEADKNLCDLVTEYQDKQDVVVDEDSDEDEDGDEDDAVLANGFIIFSIIPLKLVTYFNYILK